MTGRAVDPLARWAGLGAGSAIRLDEVEIRLVELELIEPVRTSRGEHRRRPVVLVRLSGTGNGVRVEGWGECAALADASYDRENVDSAFSTLERALAPALLSESRTEGQAGTTGTLPSMGALRELRSRAPGAPLAYAALEMAVADTHLRARETSLADLLGVSRDQGPVPVGAVVGEFGDDVHGLINRVDALVDQGYTRVKMKIGHGADIEPIKAVRGAHPGLFLQADANEDYTEADFDHLAELDTYALACLEQPFAQDDLATHARLAKRIATPICLDESLDGPEKVRSAVEMGACSVVCVKPSRLGGIGPALEVIRDCAAQSVPVWIGGMFETGFARAVNTALAAASGSPWPGDLSPAGSYLRPDVLPRAAEAHDPRRVVPSRAPGMGPALDQAVVDRFTSRIVRFGPGSGPG
jgi:O-succinylbenzoate synthase